MKYQSTSERTTIISEEMGGNSEMRKIKRKLILSISVELVVMTIYLVLQIGVSIYDRFQNARGIFVELSMTLISIVYLIAFLIILTRYFPRGIWIFTWLTFAQLICGSILLIFAIMGIIISLSIIRTVGAEIVVDVIFAIIGISIIILSIFIILRSFTLLEMQYESAANRATMIKSGTDQDFKQNPEIRRTRCRLLVLLFVELILLLLRFIQQTVFADSYTSTPSVHTKKDGITEEILSTLMPTIQLIIFIIMVFRYIRIGILVFAWISIIEMITAPILIITESIKTAREFPSASQGETVTFAITILVIVAIVLIIFLIFITILAFKLAKLIKQSHSQSVI